MIRGSPSESYNLLLKYSHILEKENESTIISLKLDGNNNFFYYFVSIGSCINDFFQCIKPVIVVDGTHLKRLYCGTMFVATCLDRNNQLYQLAIEIENFENNDFWEWFMMDLHGAIGDVLDLLIISNRCTSIQRAVIKIFHSVIDDVCFYHGKR